MKPEVKPNYGGSGLVNLMASIVAGRGGVPRHALLTSLSEKDISAARNVVLFIVDGLGDAYLARRGAGGELARRRRGAITSVFPPTTASAITTSYTGCTPLEHGLTGWFTYFGQAGCVAMPLPFRSRGSNVPLDARSNLFAAPSLFDSLAVRSIVVTWKPLVDSTYNLHHCGRAERRAYETPEGLVAETVAAVKSGPERKLVYAYWPEYDSTSHRYGHDSAEAAAQLATIDRAFGKLVAGLAGTDSIVVVTADHGFMDSPADETLDLPVELAGMLRFPLCGERRVAFCHVHDEKSFVVKARSILKDLADVRPSRELVEQGWFGPGAAHPRFAERIGDVALVMRGNATIKDWLPGEPRHLHIGNHGGTSEAEMRIPLVVERA